MRLLLLTLCGAIGVLAQDPFQVRVVGHGQPMILIAGLYSSGETWDTTVAHFQDRFQCHILTVAGFAGVPRIPAPILDHVRDGMADYIRKNKLEKPVIVGHSLGGFLALAFAVKYPEIPAKLVIVDASPFMLGATTSPDVTPAQAKTVVAQMRQGMKREDQQAYEADLRSGTGFRNMVTTESDFRTLVDWALASDRTAVEDMLVEMFGADLREDMDKIKNPTLVLSQWRSWTVYSKDIDHERIERNLRRQYARLTGVQIEVNDTARHFIMWDDPKWMFGKMDRFLRP